MNQNNKPIIRCQCQTFTSTFVPLRNIKLTLDFILADAVSFLLLVRFEVAANKNHTIFLGQARDTGKLKNKARIRKGCAPEFKMLADYVILRNCMLA